MASNRLRDEYPEDICGSTRHDAIDITGQAVPPDNFHELVAAHYGTPLWLELLRDTIFERLTIDQRRWWHVAIAEATPAGVGLEQARRPLCIAILARQINDVNTLQFTATTEAITQAIQHHCAPTQESYQAAITLAEYALTLLEERRSSVSERRDYLQVRAAQTATMCALASLQGTADSVSKTIKLAVDRADCSIRRFGRTAEIAETRAIADLTLGVLRTWALPAELEAMSK